MKIKKHDCHIGATITGVSLRECDQSVANQIRAALVEHGMLVLPQQHLSDVEIEAFAAMIGKVLYQDYGAVGLSGGRALFRLTNLDESGAILPADDRVRALGVANALWHTDNTYSRPRAEFSFLSAKMVPPEGGNTEFCDMRLAFERLTDDERALAERLTVGHSALYSRARTGFSDWTPDELERFKEVRRPLVHMHESGRKVLCLAAHVGTADGYEPAAAQRFIDDLIERMTSPGFIYSHEWSVGDLLVWDNRCTMHRATPYPDLLYGRDMRSLRTVDVADLSDGRG